MIMPSCAALPVPTKTANGVAKPRAQGQETINIATAAVKASSDLIANQKANYQGPDG